MIRAQAFLPHNEDFTETLRATLREWRAADPEYVAFALVPEARQDLIAALQHDFTQMGTRLIGAVFPALIQRDHFVTDGLWLLRLPSGSATSLIGELDGNPVTSAQKVAAAARPALKVGESTLFLVFDAMVNNISSILDELYLELGDSVRYLGVNAGSETFQSMACLFDARHRLGNSVLAILVPQDLKYALAHGYQAPEKTLPATTSSGNRIASIDWQPAFDVYRDQIKQHYGVDLNKDNFYQNGVHFPLGISLANGKNLVRIPVGLEDGGAVYCVGEVPEYALLTLLRGPEPGSLDTVRQITQQLSLPKVADASGALMCFYCAGRRMHLGEAADREIASLAREVGLPLAGALSLGEIGSLVGEAYPHFHNGVITCVSGRAT